MNRFHRFVSLALTLLLLAGILVPAGLFAESTAVQEDAAEDPISHTSIPKTASEESLARDISKECRFNGRSGQNHALTDGTYARDYQTDAADGACPLNVIVPEGEVAGAVYIQWHAIPVPLSVQVHEDDGTWKTVTECDDCFYAQYIPLPNLKAFRVVARDDPRTVLSLCEVKVLTPGTPPDNIQLWEHPGDKVDMMMLMGHPDDEVLWFGGLLPYYAGELKKNVLVICAAMNRSYRRLELLDCLWACGVRTHPIHCVLFDFTTRSRDDVFQQWGGESRCLKLFTSYYRRYKPDVVMLHDIHGEYGHGIHKAMCYLGRKCAELAADPEKYPDQVEEYGTWDVPKIYIHLYEENQIHMDWHQPLESFGGKTAIQVAMDAMYWHKSQTAHKWAVEDGGDMDNALFGLWRTLVGPDKIGNDLFENIPSR